MKAEYDLMGAGGGKGEKRKELQRVYWLLDSEMNSKHWYQVLAEEANASPLGS